MLAQHHLSAPKSFQDPLPSFFLKTVEATVLSRPMEQPTQTKHTDRLESLKRMSIQLILSSYVILGHLFGHHMLASLRSDRPVGLSIVACRELISQQPSLPLHPFLSKQMRERVNQQDTVAPPTMGNSPSRYNDTDWNEASGGLTTASETIDGSEPTSAYMQISMVPRITPLPLVGQFVPAPREYQVKDASSGNVLFSTQKVDKLEKGFDLLDKDGSTVLLRVDSTYSNRRWHIYQVGKPVFEGQRPDPEPSAKTGQELFRKASVFYPKDELHTAMVHMFRTTKDTVDDNDVDTVLKLERCGGPAKWHFQTMRLDDTQNLVAYWKWEGGVPIPMMKEEYMVIDLAKGSDLALHIVLAVMASLERSSWKAEYTG